MPTDQRPIAVARFRDADIEELVRMWRASFEHGVGIIDPHPLEDQIRYFRSEVLPHNQVQVATREHVIVGFVAFNAQSVAQLFVRVADIGQGIGRMLLDLAKDGSAGSLWLYTFARNARACAFYESQGFRVAQRGFEPSWQLDDVKYVWDRSMAGYSS